MAYGDPAIPLTTDGLSLLIPHSSKDSPVACSITPVYHICVIPSECRCSKTVSFIDFADARYENARDMFHRDIARLTWLDIGKLIQMYKGLERTQPVVTESEPTVARMRNALQNIKWCGQEVLTADQRLFKARLAILKEEIKKLGNLLATVKATNTFKNALNALDNGGKQK